MRSTTRKLPHCTRELHVTMHPAHATTCRARVLPCVRAVYSHHTTNLSQQFSLTHQPPSLTLPPPLLPSFPPSLSPISTPLSQRHVLSLSVWRRRDLRQERMMSSPSPVATAAPTLWRPRCEKIGEVLQRTRYRSKRSKRTLATRASTQRKTDVGWHRRGATRRAATVRCNKLLHRRGPEARAGHGTGEERDSGEEKKSGEHTPAVGVEARANQGRVPNPAHMFVRPGLRGARAGAVRQAEQARLPQRAQTAQAESGSTKTRVSRP